MIIGELIITTELVVFFGVILSAIISVILYLGTLDRRISVLEARTITRDEFYQLKEEIINTVRSEIKKI